MAPVYQSKHRRSFVNAQRVNVSRKVTTRTGRTRRWKHDWNWF